MKGKNRIILAYKIDEICVGKDGRILKRNFKKDTVKNRLLTYFKI